MPIGDLLAQITGEPSPTSAPTQMSFPAKRKPEEQIRRPVDKLQKTGALAANSSRPLTQTQKPSAVDAHMAKMRLGTNSSKSSNGGNITAISFKNRRSTPPPNPGPPKAPPKKGSFAEIMARGKVAQASLGQVGKISHKKIEKLPSKREREEMKSQKSLKLQKNLGPNGKFKAAGQEIMQNTRNGSTLSVKAGKQGKKSVEPPPEKKVKKAALATTGYAGTARPKPGSAKGSSKSAASSSSRYDRGPDRYREDRRGSSGARYAYVSEDEDEEDDDDGDEEDEQDYDSESDMEAAVFEVDEEEELAARIARKEDAEALAEENRHKREKEEKRKRLAAMARSRR